jgi:hypothetical protein
MHRFAVVAQSLLREPFGIFAGSVATTRRDFIKTTALALPLLATGCHSVSKASANASDFVTIRNRRFERRGQPYFFIGANFPQAAMLADSNLTGGRESVVRELDQLRSIGVTNLRVMADLRDQCTEPDNALSV